LALPFSLPQAVGMNGWHTALGWPAYGVAMWVALGYAAHNSLESCAGTCLVYCCSLMAKLQMQGTHMPLPHFDPHNACTFKCEFERIIMRYLNWFEDVFLRCFMEITAS